MASAQMKQLAPRVFWAGGRFEKPGLWIWLFRRNWRILPVSKWLLARFRLDMRAVCDLSAGRGLYDDFHDYPDDVIGTPAHFVEMTCKRCGKRFCI